jgi:hypothetical protein
MLSAAARFLPGSFLVEAAAAESMAPNPDSTFVTVN